MRKPTLLLMLWTTLTLLAGPVWAQRGGDGGGGGDRGGFGGRGGDSGGSRGGFGGGPPGGGFSSRGGDSGGRGGFGGGPPGGGFGGGPPGGGFSSRGGGDSSRGGPPGGASRGGPGGSGFNPADMLKRFDRNGNNMIDPDESSGPAQFFLQRLAQSNPKIDLKKPVPIDLLTSEMEKMRGGRGSDGDSGSSATSNEPELLVPDFRLLSEPMPVEGFGAGSSLFNVKVEDRDLKEAEDRMKRYDSNRDGLLTQDELKAGRWSDDPMQYDRNRDGKLSKSELALRYANRRVTDQERRTASNDSRDRPDRGGWSRSGGEQEPEKEPIDRFGDAKSYRLQSSRPQGLPDFFARSDADGDGQVLMSEYSSSWSQETLDEFLKWDLDRDGIITARECVAALSNGVRVTSSSGSPASSSASSGSYSPASSPRPSSSSSGSSSDVNVEWAQRQIAKYDKNGDGELTANEWEKMIIKPTGADSNGDGIITLDEYAAFRSK